MLPEGVLDRSHAFVGREQPLDVGSGQKNEGVGATELKPR
jgi:hypothetical protein